MAWRNIPIVPVDMQNQRVGLPAHGGRVGLEEETANKVDEECLVHSLTELLHQGHRQPLVMFACVIIT